MIYMLLTLFCLIVSFCFNNKKMKVLSYCQAVLSFFMFFLMIILSPRFSIIFEKNSTFFEYLEIVKDVVLNYQCSGISIIKIVLFAIVFLTMLSIFTIVEYIKDKNCTKDFEKEILVVKKKYPTFVYIKNKRKTYLILRRLLN